MTRTATSGLRGAASPLLIVVLVGLLAGAHAASAETLLTLRRDADDFINPSGKSTGAKDQKVAIWIGADRVLRDDGRSAQLLRLDLGRLCLIDHGTKTYTVIEIEKRGDAYSVKGKARAFEPPNDLEEFSRLHATVTPMESVRQVGSWKAKLTQIAIANKMSGGIDLDWWASSEPKVADSSYRTLLVLLASLHPLSKDTGWMKAIVEIPGTPVRIEKRLKLPDSVVKTTEELKSVEEKDPPAGTFDPPAGYKALDLMEFLRAAGTPEVP